RTEREWDEALETVRLEYGPGTAFDPDLAHYVVTDGAGTLTVRTIEHAIAARLQGPGYPADYLKFSPDGLYLAARFTSRLHPGQTRPLRVWEWRTGRIVLDLPNTPQPMFSFDFHPSGTGMVVGNRQSVEWYGLPDGNFIRPIRFDSDPGWLAF